MSQRHRTHHFGFVPMAPIIREGERGRAKVDHFTITGREFMGFRRYDHIAPGTYARLFVGGDVMMSDTQMEQMTNWSALRRADGRVLIAGLGLGMLLLPMLRKPGVTAVHVVEREPDVIRLIEPQIRKAAKSHARKLTIHEADAHTWEPPSAGRQFETVWLDIWGSCSTDELKEMRDLRRRYRRWLVPGGWLGSWWWEHLHDLKRERGW
jgi:spermidine synthase